MINNDLPITKCCEERLNRNQFAKSLAKTLVRYSPEFSFVIGLYGAWGRGKTRL